MEERLHAARIDRFPENASIFRPGGRTVPVGQVMKQTNLAKTIFRMIEAETTYTVGAGASTRAAELIITNVDSV